MRIEIVEALKIVTSRYRNALNPTGYSEVPFAALRAVCERIAKDREEAMEYFIAVTKNPELWAKWNPMWGYSKDQYKAYKNFLKGDEIAKNL